MTLATNITPGRIGHAALHNEERALLNVLASRNGDVFYADEYASLALAIAAAGANGTVILSRKSYTVETGLDLPGGVHLVGAHRDETIITGAGSVLTPTGARSGWNLSRLTLRSTGDHLVVPRGGVFAARFNDVAFVQEASDKSIWYTANATDGDLEACCFENCRLTLTPTHSVPGWVQVGSGNVNQNCWRDCICYYGPADGWFFDFRNISDQNWAYANTWKNIVFELTPGGLIRLLSAYHSVIEQCHLYDYVGGNTEDLIYLGRDTQGNQPCYNTRISDFARYGGSMATGKYDISVADARLTLLENCHSGPFATWALEISENSVATTTLHATPPSAV